MHLVVANMLDRRKEEVQLVEAAPISGTDTLEFQSVALQRDKDQPFIERQLVDRIAQRHRKFQSLPSQTS